MQQRRIVGLDLGVATSHTAHVIDEHAQVVAKRRVEATVAGFTALNKQRWLMLRTTCVWRW